MLDRFREVAGDQLTQAQFLDHNRDFHAAVADLAGNTRLAAVENSMVEEFDRLVLVNSKAHKAEWIPHAVNEHKMITDAIQTHDSDAASRLVHSHIVAGQERCLANLPHGTNIEPG
jgi:DNA-binding GntR family transcriptional regulator